MRIINLCIYLGLFLLKNAYAEPAPIRDVKSQAEVVEIIVELTSLVKKNMPVYDKSEYDENHRKLLSYANKLTDIERVKIYEIVRKEIKVVPYRVFPDQKRTEKEEIAWKIVSILLETTSNKDLITIIVCSTPDSQVGLEDLGEYLKNKNFNEADMKIILDKSENEKVRAFLIDRFAKSNTQTK